MPTVGDHVVILGASMAGLATAAALADRFERVTVVERDALPSIGAHRKGVPQGRHGHALLAAGLDGLSSLLPDLVDDLRVAGAEMCDRPDDLRLYMNGGRVRTQLVDRVVVSASRPLIEGIVRERVRELPNVTFLEEHDVLGVVTDPRCRRVTAARIQPRVHGGTERQLPADLVVDATGRGSRATRWLKDLGYQAPAEDRVHVDVRYTTRLFQREPTHLDGSRQVLVASRPGDLRRCYLQAIEGDRWLLTLVGYLGTDPGTDLADVADFAARLASREAHEIVTGATPVGAAATATFKSSVRRRYEHLRRFPEGFIVLGDAICSFNPTYGQGMSVAAQEALLLASLLERYGLTGVARRFFRRAKPLIDVPWDLSVGGDLTVPGVDGPRTLRWRLVTAWVARVSAASHRDPVVGRALLDVMGLIAPPTLLLSPSIVRRVLAAGRQPSRHPTPDPVLAGPRRA